MRTTPSVYLLMILAANTASAAVAPTRLEGLAHSADAVVTRSHEIGRLRAPDAVATLTVVAVAGRAGTEPPLRGVRFDLTSNEGTNRVYLDANQLNVLRNELDLIVRYGHAVFAESRPNLKSGGTMVHGTESCWMPNPQQRILCPSARVGSNWSGMSLGAFGGPSFDFRGVEVRELLQLVDRAIVELHAR